MASGILGSAMSVATNNVVAYSVPAGKVASCSLNLTNCSTSGTTVKIALAASGTPLTKEYIEWRLQLNAGDTFERTGLVMDATKNLVIYADSSNVAINVYGFEE